jgi:hypothetical protein
LKKELKKYWGVSKDFTENFHLKANVKDLTTSWYLTYSLKMVLYSYIKSINIMFAKKTLKNKPQDRYLLDI